MASAPLWKVYRNKRYVAATKYAEDAACLVSSFGGEVRYNHKYLVWTEGAEAFPAGESYDRAADVMCDRVAKIRQRFQKAQADWSKPKTVTL